LLIVLPITSSVNQTVGNPVLDHRTLRADSFPIPPPKKLHRGSTSLVADSFPIPPPKKLHRDSTSLVADSFPIPPPKKLHRTSAAAFVIA
jgi:hypothetical protein